MRTTERRPTLDAALLILLVGFAFSMASNLLWTWQGGVVRILGGALASLALPGAIHLWPRIPVAAPVQVWGCRVPVMRIVRAVAMTGIACMAAFTTFSHASALLVFHGEAPLLATLYPVMTELLVVMGVLARHTSAPAPVKPRVERAPRKPTVKTPPIVPTETAAAEDDEQAGCLKWARANWPKSAKEIKLATGCSRGYSFKIAKRVREERAS